MNEMNLYLADFGIEGTISATDEYSSIPISKFTNLKIKNTAGSWINLPSSAAPIVKVANEGYRIVECTNNSFVAGTVTQLTSGDCNHVAVRNQVPIFGNIVKIVSTGTPISIPLAAVDTDKDYLSYKLASQPTYGVTGLGNNAPLTTNTDGTTSQVPYDPPSPPVSDSFRVSVTDKRDGHTREALISIVGPTPGPTIPSPVDDLAYAVSGNTITLSWSHPEDGGSEITHYKIERSIDTDTWSLVNTVSETSTSYTITGQPGYAKYHRIFAYNSIGQSAPSNVIQPRIIDTSPPVITINTPTTNQVITSQNIHVTSNIFEYDNSGIENIQMTMDHVLTTDPISVSRIGIVTATATSEITGVDNGQRTLTVRASNGDGYIGSQSVSFTKNTPTSQNLISFEDNFEGDIAPNWHTTTEDDEYWDIRNPSRMIPDSVAGNKVVGTEDCDNKCGLTMIHTVNTSAMTEPKLSFYRYLSSSLDNGEGLDVSVSTDGGTTFTVLDSFVADDSEDDNTWHFEEYSLANYASAQFKLKFVATSNSNSEDTEIDTLKIYDAYIPADTTPPIITAPADIISEATGTLTVIPINNATATDDSTPIIISNNATDSIKNGFPLGITIINWTATDDSNNSSTATQTITIHDTTAPTITVPDDYTAEATGILTALGTADYGTATATDLVDANPTITSNATASFTLGTTIVRWSAIDDDGNSIPSDQRITIQDTTPPTIVAPVDMSFNSTGELTPLTQNDYGTATATDLVDANPTITSNATATFPVGDTIILWSATDDYGKSASATQIVTVNLVMQNRTLFGDAFDLGLGEWVFKEQPNNAANQQYCRIANSGVYSLTHSDEHGGSAHTMYSDTCWFGLTGGAKSFAIPSVFDGDALSFTLDYRSLADLRFYTHIGHVNNIYYTVSDSNGLVLDHGIIFQGARQSATHDTAWQDVAINIPSVSSSSCPCEIFIYTADSWSAEWNKQIYFDNVDAMMVATASGSSGSDVIPNRLSTDELFGMLFSNGTQVMVNTKHVYDNSIFLRWDDFDDATQYKVVIAPSSDPRDKFAEIVSDAAQYRFINLLADTQYDVRVGIRGDDSTQSAFQIRTLPDGVMSFDNELSLNANLVDSSDKVDLSWDDFNNIGENRYRVERSVDGNGYELTGLGPKFDTVIQDTIRPDWLGKTVSYRAFEWLGNQKVYSNMADVVIPATLESPQNIHAQSSYIKGLGEAVRLSWDHAPLVRNYTIEKQNTDGTWQRLEKIQTNHFEYPYVGNHAGGDELSFRMYTQLGSVVSLPSAIQYVIPR